MSISLADLLSGYFGMGAMFGGGSGKRTFLVLIAAASIAVPDFWKHKYAPLAFLAPILFTAKTFWPVYEQYSRARNQMVAMGELGQAMQQMAGEMTSGISLGIGGYAVIAAGAYLAFKGVVRFLGRS